MLTDEHEAEPGLGSEPEVVTEDGGGRTSSHVFVFLKSHW